MARIITDETEGFELSASPSHLLHRVEQLAADRFAQLVEERVTLRQFAVLAAIAEKPGLSQSDLVRATGIDRSTIGEMLTRMERTGWIVRAANERDGRAHAVDLAAEGSRLLAAATHHARAADAAILDALPRTKRRTFLSILSKLAEFSDAAADKADRETKKKKKKERTKAREKKKKDDKEESARKRR